VLLWNVWAGGLLCVDVATLGVPLDTGLFSNLFGESFAALFDPANPSPVGVITAPVAPPTAVFYDDGAPIRIALNDFGLDFSASMDDRDLRLFRVGVLAEVGIDPNLSATAFEPALAIDTNAIAFTEPYNELVTPGFSAGLAEFIPTVLSSLLPDDLLPTIAIPSFLGVGLKTAFWEPDDSGSGWAASCCSTLRTCSPSRWPAAQAAASAATASKVKAIPSTLRRSWAAARAARAAKRAATAAARPPARPTPTATARRAGLAGVC
jgi:hypothetical protein